MTTLSRAASQRIDRVSAAGLVAAAIQLALVGLVIWTIFQYQRATDARQESYRIVQGTDATLIALLNAETGQRGYMITSDPAFLEPYHAGVDEIDEQLAELDAEIAAGTVQDLHLERAKQLITAKLMGMEATLELAARGEIDSARERTLAEAGRAQMDAIRLELAAIREREAARLDNRIRELQNLGIVSVVAVSALPVIALITLGWLIVAIRSQHESRTLRELATAKDEFVGFVSHELRSPIAIIAGNARLLASDGALAADEQREAAQEIADAGERLESVVATLLSLAKAEAGTVLEVEPVLLHRIAERVRRLHRVRFPERETQLRTTGEVRPAMGDADAIEQVLVNLLSNAEKYGDPYAPIVIEVEEAEETIRVTVTNDGPVLDDREFSRVFEPFFQLSARPPQAAGIGLGLTICNRLVVAMGGRLSARAMPEGGARFSFTLPAVQEGQDAA